MLLIAGDVTQNGSLRDRHGLIGPEQARWFKRALADKPDEGWFRIGVINHEPAELRDADLVADLLDLFVPGRGAVAERLGRLFTLAPGGEVETRDH